MACDLPMDTFTAKLAVGSALQQPASLDLARCLTADVAERGIEVFVAKVDCEYGLHYRVCPVEGAYFLNAFNCRSGAEAFISRHGLLLA